MNSKASFHSGFTLLLMCFVLFLLSGVDGMNSSTYGSGVSTVIKSKMFRDFKTSSKTMRLNHMGIHQQMQKYTLCNFTLVCHPAILSIVIDPTQSSCEPGLTPDAILYLRATPNMTLEFYVQCSQHIFNTE